MASQPHPRDRKRRGRLIATALSVAAHLGLLLVIFSARTPPSPPEPEAISVSMFDGLPAPNPGPPADPGPPAPAAEPAPPEPPKPPPPPKIKARPTRAPPTIKPILVADQEEEEQEAPPAPPSDAQIAGATVAGSGSGTGAGGGGGGGVTCDMVRRLQFKLREDAMVQAAFAGAHRRYAPGAKAIWLWNGDWVRSPGEDGKGLSVVRQAVIWEVGFAPEACRSKAMHGLVLISLNDSPGSPRLAIGSGSWRWPDLLFPRKGG